MVKLTRLKEFLSLNGFEMEKISRDVIPCDKTKKVIDTYKLTKNNKVMYLHVKMSGEAQFILTAKCKTVKCSLLYRRKDKMSL